MVARELGHITHVNQATPHLETSRPGEKTFT